MSVVTKTGQEEVIMYRVFFAISIALISSINLKSEHNIYTLDDIDYIHTNVHMRGTDQGGFVFINVKDSNSFNTYIMPTGSIMHYFIKDGKVENKVWSKSDYDMLIELIVRNDTLNLNNCVLSETMNSLFVNDSYMNKIDSIAEFGQEHFLNYFFDTDDYEGQFQFRGKFNFKDYNSVDEWAAIKTAVIAKLIEWRYFVFSGDGKIMYYKKMEPLEMIPESYRHSYRDIPPPTILKND